ncbi:MAG: hypothetical protein JWM28_2743 [Chitinophagaceae bacterium]|nr:hypothetical protein [Chitinophagaceae bacterium]
MNNPFDVILEKLIEIEDKIAAIPQVADKKEVEIIDRTELCKRLAVAPPTLLRWERAKKIPVIRFGSNVRYNWYAVIKHLENAKS